MAMAKEIVVLFLPIAVILSLLSTSVNEFSARLLPSSWEDAPSISIHQYNESRAADDNLLPPQHQSDPVERLLSVHRAEYPATQAGRWVYRPEEALHPSPEHLMCLEREKQGNCHNQSMELLKDKKGLIERIQKLKKGAIVNSPGILEANDPWVWESDLEEYKVMSHALLYHPDTSRILFGDSLNRTIYLMGDSLTRQWKQSLLCDAQHLFGLTEDQAARSIQFLWATNKFPYTTPLRNFLNESTPEDYLIFNFGHHIDPMKMEEWETYYHQVLSKAFLNPKFGKISSNHIFFRTTAVRHFHYGKGDWNTNVSSAGGESVNMKAQWNMYGGLTPVQPEQNLIALELYQNLSQAQQKKKLKVGGILDTSPMTLARADATFDGSHFCLPGGPIEYWSRMLYHRIYTEEMKKRNQ